MKKIHLNLEDLEVESFATTPEDPAGSKGTVFGHVLTMQTIDCDPQCTDGGTTCADTCGASCGGTCDTCVTCAGSCQSCGATCNSCGGGATCHIMRTCFVDCTNHAICR